MEGLKVTGRSFLCCCVSNVITKRTEASLILEPLFLFATCSAMGFEPGVESVPEAPLLTLCIVPFDEGQLTGRLFLCA